MPRLSDSMQEGTIAAWLKAGGEVVSRGDEMVEIETDKATVSYAADTSGILQILAPAGATLPIGAVIARIDDDIDPASPTTSGPVRGRGSPGASPVARRLAAQLGVDLDAVAGSGPGGRIVKADVAAAGLAAAVESEPGAAEEAVPARGAGGRHGLSRMQLTIARRMTESSATVPDFAISIDVDMAAATALRSRLTTLATDDAPAPSLNDMIVKASAIALRRHPQANGSYRDEAFELHPRVNIGIAVAAPDALTVPTVFDADRRSLHEITRETRRLGERARHGTLTPAELSGATFTISNLGMYGVSSFVAIVNTPQAAILAVGSVRDEAVVRDGAIVPGRRMTLTLTCDHRILYGAPAAQFLAEIRTLLEEPLSLLL
jgi:pyruvate dehydrogenase E2 component (dihydrolipoyllysine-residue acetyltransferase)